MKIIIFYTIAIKVFLFLAIFLAFSLLPFNKQMHDVNFLAHKSEPITFQTALSTWDSQHYLYLIAHGYAKDSQSSAFFPLFPLIAQVFNYFIHNPFLVGFLLANIISFGTVGMLYVLLREEYTSTIAENGVLFFLVFPTAFYLSLIYTESLFLLLIFSFFYFLKKHLYLFASIMALLLPMAKAQGVLIILPFMLFMYLDSQKKKTTIELPSFNQKVVIQLFPQYLYTVSPLLGFGIYLLFMNFTTGDALTGFTMQNEFIGHYSVSNLLAPTVFFQSLFTHDLSVHSFLTSMIDRIFFICYLISLPFIYKYEGKVYFIYALLFGLTPLLGSFMAYTRYVFMVFPLYILFAIFCSKPRFDFLKIPFVLLLFSLQIVFTILQGLNYWVS